MYLLIEFRDIILIWCHRNCTEVVKFNCMHEVDISRTYRYHWKNLDVLRAEGWFLTVWVFKRCWLRLWFISPRHGLSQQGVWVSFWTPKPWKSTPWDTQIFLWGISLNVNRKHKIEFFHHHIIPMTLYMDIMPYFDKYIHVYGWNLSILWSPLKIWTPKNLTMANFRHPVSNSWLRHWSQVILWWVLGLGSLFFSSPPPPPPPHPCQVCKPEVYFPVSLSDRWLYPSKGFRWFSRISAFLCFQQK